MTSGDVSHDADAPGWRPSSTHCVIFTAAPGGGRLIPFLTQHGPWLLPPSSWPDPARPTPTFPVLVMAAPLLQSLKRRTLLSPLTVLYMLHSVSHPSGNPVGLSCKASPEPDHRSPPLLPQLGPGPPEPCLLPPESLCTRLPTPHPSYSRLHPVAQRILIKGKVIHVIPLLRRLQ